MKRSAFTTLEIVLVVVFLILLLNLVVDKMGSMSKRAEEVNLKSFFAALNRTSAGGFWLRSINDGYGGDVANPDYDLIIDQYIEIVPGFSTGPAFVNCNTEGDGVFLTYPLSMNYEVHCKNGTKSEGPIFQLYNVDKLEYIY